MELEKDSDQNKADVIKEPQRLIPSASSNSVLSGLRVPWLLGNTRPCKFCFTFQKS